jgi:hypothetical protein
MRDIMTTACGQYAVQDCLCGDCEALNVPESEHIRADRERREHERSDAARHHFDSNPCQFGYPSYRG